MNMPIEQPEMPGEIKINISTEQEKKLSKYFMNADPFLWSVLESKNKKGRLKEIQSFGFLTSYSESSNPIYRDINRDLLLDVGIKVILGKIVVPKIVHYFKPEILRHFRDCWDQGQTPDLNYLKANNLFLRHLYHTHEVYKEKPFYRPADPTIVGYRDSAFIFVQIDTQHNFVERWTVFAGLWFTEIEPIIETENKMKGI
jgi:hypothetical protein